MRFFYTFIYILFILTFPSFSQQKSPDVELVNLANEMFNFGDKKDALAVYLQAVELNPDNISANLMAGRCYIETISKELSVTYLIKAYELDKNVLPDILFKIGQGYQFGSRFDDAIKYYELYKQNLTDEKTAKMSSNVMNEVIRSDRKIFECQNGKKYLAAPKNYIIENLKDVINSEYPDYVPSVTADQKTLIFTSRRSGGVGKNKDTDNEFFEDIWIAKKKDNGEWGYPTNVGPPINTISHDANVSISPDGKRIFIFKPENEGDLFECEIKPDGKWTQPKSLGSNINTKYRELSVTISQDGKSLYFSSNREGGFGGLDLYRSRLDENQKWGTPENLGSAVNTEYDEDAPFIDSDGKTLYFSSQGHKGIGGYDIYKSVWDQPKRSWTLPENMGFPLNSPDHDIYFVLSGDRKTGYYASAKGDGFGDKDIYKIYLSPDENDISKLQKDAIATIEKKQIEDIALPTLSLANKKKITASTKTDANSRVGSIEKTILDKNLMPQKIANTTSTSEVSASVLNLPNLEQKNTNRTSKDAGNEHNDTPNTSNTSLKDKTNKSLIAQNSISGTNFNTKTNVLKSEKTETISANSTNLKDANTTAKTDANSAISGNSTNLKNANSSAKTETNSAISANSTNLKDANTTAKTDANSAISANTTNLKDANTTAKTETNSAISANSTNLKDANTTAKTDANSTISANSTNLKDANTTAKTDANSAISANSTNLKDANTTAKTETNSAISANSTNFKDANSTAKTDANSAISANSTNLKDANSTAKTDANSAISANSTNLKDANTTAKT
ncbi:MAG: hypothetical protein EAZ27_03385, partial [Cytophagales bacterium]